MGSGVCRVGVLSAVGVGVERGIEREGGRKGCVGRECGGFILVLGRGGEGRGRGFRCGWLD